MADSLSDARFGIEGPQLGTLHFRSRVGAHATCQRISRALAPHVLSKLEAEQEQGFLKR